MKIHIIKNNTPIVEDIVQTSKKSTIFRTPDDISGIHKDTSKKSRINAVISELEDVRLIASRKGDKETEAEASRRIKELLNILGNDNDNTSGGPGSASSVDSDKNSNSEDSESSNKGKIDSQQDKKNSEDKSNQEQSSTDDKNSEAEQNSEDDSKSSSQSKDKENSEDQDGSQSNSQQDQDQSNDKNQSSSNSDQDQNKTDDKDNQSNASSSSKSVQINNPFGQNPNKFNQMSSGQQDSSEEPETIEGEEAIKAVLGALMRGEADGALAAINDKIASMSSAKESLSEAVIDDMTDDEIEDLINNNLDFISGYKSVNTIEPEDVRLKKFNKKVKSKSFLSKIDRENKSLYDKNFNHNVNKVDITHRKYGKKVKIEDLDEVIAELIADQLGRKVVKSYDTYSEYNKKNAYSKGVLYKGTRKYDKKIINKPTVLMFLDCSGSFSEYDIDNELKLLSKIRKYEEAGQIDITVWYFTDDCYLTYEQARPHGCNGGMPHAVEIIRNEQARHDEENNIGAVNAIFISDSDEQGHAEESGYAEITGMPIGVWKYGFSSDKFFDHVYNKADEYIESEFNQTNE